MVVASPRNAETAEPGSPWPGAPLGLPLAVGSSRAASACRAIRTVGEMGELPPQVTWIKYGATPGRRATTTDKRRQRPPQSTMADSGLRWTEVAPSPLQHGGPVGPAGGERGVPGAGVRGRRSLLLAAAGPAERLGRRRPPGAAARARRRRLWPAAVVRPAVLRARALLRAAARARRLRR